MDKVTEDQVVSAFKKVGIRSGDDLLIHSAIQFLGIPVGGVEMYLDAVINVIGADGTLAVPTFNFGFARGEPFDLDRTPSEGMGVFSECVRKQAKAKRTHHPMQSLALIGPHAEILSYLKTKSAFDDGSAYALMLELGFKLLLIGADIQAVSMLHYCEQRADVPYRYWKDFTGPVRYGQDWEIQTFKMFVRDLDIDPHLDLHPVQEYLQEKGQWNSTSLNYGEISSCHLKDFVAAVDIYLEDDPWSLVTNRKQ